MIEQFCIYWQNKKTGESGKGEPSKFKDLAAWVDEMNAKYPDIDHWVADAGFSLENIDLAKKHQGYPVLPR